MDKGNSIVCRIFGGVKGRVVACMYMQRDSARLMPARAIAREAGVPYGSIDRALRDLVRDEILVRVETEDGPRYRAPFEDPRLRGLFDLVRQDSDVVAQLREALREEEGVAYAALFGSFAAGKAGRTSDIDVLVIEADSNRRFAVMTAIAQVADRLGREINPEFYAPGEFENKLRDGDAIATHIAENPLITLKGEASWPTPGN